MEHVNLSLEDFRDVNAGLAKADAITRKSLKSIMQASGPLPMPAGDSTEHPGYTNASVFAWQVITGKATGYAYQRTYDKMDNCPMMTIIITDVHTTKPVKENVGAKNLTYQEFALWVRNEETGTPSFVWLKNFKDLETGLWQFNVAKGAQLTGQFAIVPAMTKLVNQKADKSFKFVQYKCDTLVQCGGPWNTRTASDTDVLAQKAAFHDASSQAVYTTKFKLNFSL